MRVELCKKFLDAHGAHHEHPGLVTIISGTPVALAKGTCNGDLDDLFAIAEDAELGLAAEDFAPSYDGSLAGLIGQAVIFDDLFFFKGKCNRALLFGHASLLSWCCTEIITEKNGAIRSIEFSRHMDYKIRMTFQTTQIQVPEGFIDLGRGDPGMNLLPLDLLRIAAQDRLTQTDPAFLQYGFEQGDGYFRRALADFLSKSHGLPVDLETLFVTSG